MGKVVIGWVKIPAGKLEEQVWWVLQNSSGGREEGRAGAAATAARGRAEQIQDKKANY